MGYVITNISNGNLAINGEVIPPHSVGIKTAPTVTPLMAELQLKQLITYTGSDSVNRVESYVTPTDFKAAGNGVTDDYAAIVAAANYAVANNMTMYIDRSYAFASLWTLPNGLILRSDLSNKSVLRFIGDPLTTQAVDIAGAVDIDGIVFEGNLNLAWLTDFGQRTSPATYKAFLGIHNDMTALGNASLAGVKIGRMRVQNHQGPGYIIANLIDAEIKRLEAFNLLGQGMILSGLQNSVVSEVRCDNIGNIKGTGSRNGQAVLIDSEPAAAVYTSWYNAANVKPLFGLRMHHVDLSRTTDSAFYINNDRDTGISDIEIDLIKVRYAGKDAVKMRSAASRCNSIRIGHVDAQYYANEGLLISNSKDVKVGSAHVDGGGYDTIGYMMTGTPGGSYALGTSSANTLGKSINTNCAGMDIVNSDQVIVGSWSVTNLKATPFDGSQGIGFAIVNACDVTLGTGAMANIEGPGKRISNAHRLKYNSVLKDVARLLIGNPAYSAPLGVYVNDDTPAYSSATIYTEGSACTFGGLSYRRTALNILTGANKQPDTNPTYWTVWNTSGSHLDLTQTVVETSGTAYLANPLRINGSPDIVRVDTRIANPAHFLLTGGVINRVSATATRVDLVPVQHWRSSASLTSNANGDIAIAHGMYGTPRARASLVGSTSLRAVTYALDATNATFRLVNANSTVNLLAGRNYTYAGAVVGTPGTLPTNMVAPTGALSSEVVATGTENGDPYVDIRIYGSPSGTISLLRLDGATGVATALGDAVTLALPLRMIAGAVTNINGLTLRLGENNSGGSELANTSGVDLLSTISATSVRSVSRTMTGATAAYVSPYIRLNTTASQAIDITLRFGGVGSGYGGWLLQKNTNAFQTVALDYEIEMAA